MENQTVNIYVKQIETWETPREYTDLSKMICFDKKNPIGDKHDYLDIEELEEDEEFINAPVKIKLYIFEHSGITLKTYSQCGWDSRPVGYIYMTEKTFKEEFKEINEDTLKKVNDILLKEVKEYDLYLQGEYYQFQIKDMNDVVLCEDDFMANFTDNIKKTCNDICQDRNLTLNKVYYGETEYIKTLVYKEL